MSRQKRRDATTTLEEIKEVVARFREERGWKGEDLKNAAISLNLEATEVLELFNWVDGKRVLKDERLKLAVAEELSDVLWWVIVMMQSLKLDMTETFFLKHRKRGEKYALERFSRDLPLEERTKNYYALKAKTRGGHPLAESVDENDQ